MVIPSAAPARQSPRRKVSRWPIVIGVLALVAIAAIVIGLLAIPGTNDNGAPPANTRVALTGITSFDPYGDNKTENSGAAPNVTDGDQATYWSTEHYNDAPSLDKPGVGVVVDAGTPVELTRLTVVTDTPGFKAQIRATNTEGGTTEDVSAAKVVGTTTSFDVSSSGPKRYYVVWITQLPPDRSYAHVNEVQGFKS
jgi:hypothetical protein